MARLYAVIVLSLLAFSAIIWMVPASAGDSSFEEEVASQVKMLLEKLSSQAISYGAASSIAGNASECLTDNTLAVMASKLATLLGKARNNTVLSSQLATSIESLMEDIRIMVVEDASKGKLIGCNASLLLEFLLVSLSRPLTNELLVDPGIAEGFSRSLETSIWHSRLSWYTSDVSPAITRAIRVLTSYATSNPLVRIAAAIPALTGSIDHEFWARALSLLRDRRDYCYLFSQINYQYVPRSVATRGLREIAGPQATVDYSYLLPTIRYLDSVCASAVMMLASNTYHDMVEARESLSRASGGMGPAYTLSLVALVSYLDASGPRIANTTSKPGLLDLWSLLGEANLLNPIIASLVFARFRWIEPWNRVAKGFSSLGFNDAYSALIAAENAEAWSAAYLWSVAVNTGIAEALSLSTKDLLRLSQKLNTSFSSIVLATAATPLAILSLNPLAVPDYEFFKAMAKKSDAIRLLRENKALALHHETRDFTLKALKAYLNDSARVWSRLAIRLSIPVSGDALQEIKEHVNITLFGGSIAKDSARLAAAIARGSVRARSIEEAGWLARAASLREINNNLVLFLPTLRITAYILLKKIDPEHGKLAPWRLKPGTTDPLRLWAYGFIPTVSTPKELAKGNLAALVERAKEAARLLRQRDPELAGLVEGIASSIERGDYATAMMLAERLRDELRRRGLDLDLDTFLSLAKLSSIRLEDKGLTINLDEYRGLIRGFIIGKSGGSIEKMARMVEETARTSSSPSGLRDVMEALSGTGLREKIIEVIRLHGGEDILRKLLEASSSLSGRVREANRSLGGLGLLPGIGGFAGPFSSRGAGHGWSLPPLPGLPGLEAPAAGLPLLGSRETIMGVVAVSTLALLVAILYRYKGNLTLFVRRATTRLIVRARFRGLQGEEPQELRWEIIARFRQLLEACSKVYGPKPPYATHREYEAMVSGEARKYYHEAALAYEEAKFSDHPVSKEHVKRIVEAIKRVLR
ncbi:MAG: DUF4129 domain-containing protein [Pyrodictiaceae archaeon]